MWLKNQHNFRCYLLPMYKMKYNSKMSVNRSWNISWWKNIRNKGRKLLFFGMIASVFFIKMEASLANSDLWLGLPSSVRKEGEEAVFVDPERVLIGNAIPSYCNKNRFKKWIDAFQKYNLGNFVLLGVCNPIPKCGVELAQILKDKGLYFLVSTGQNPDIGEKVLETVKEIKKRCGDYFLGVYLHEAGAPGKLIGKHPWPALIKHPGYDGVGKADEFVNSLKTRFVDFWHKNGIPAIIQDNVLLITYIPLTGCDIPFVEQIYCMTAQVYTAFTRGMAKVYNVPWGADLSIWNGDIEPMQNPEENYLALLSTYFAGARIIINEHHPWKDPFADKLELRPWGEALQKFYKMVRRYNEVRGKPLVKIGIIRGYGDGWQDWGGCIWGNRFANSLEHDWDYLNVFFPGYGSVEGMKNAVVGTPYGQVDVILSNSPREAYSSYEALIFLGPNWMNKPTYEKLKEYVAKGGILLMHAGQLKDRTGKFYNNGDFTDLFGVKLNNKIIQPHEIYKEKYLDKKRRIKTTQSFCRFIKATEFGFPARGVDDWWYNMKSSLYKYGYKCKGQIKLYECSFSEGAEIIAEATGAQISPRFRKEVYPLAFMKKIGQGKAILVNAPCYSDLPSRFVNDLISSVAGAISYPVVFNPRIDYLEWAILENKNTDYLVIINMSQKKSAFTQVTIEDNFKRIIDLSTGEKIGKSFSIKIEPLEFKIFKMEKTE